MGFNIALVMVGSAVAPENKNLNPRNIADQTWELFDKEKDAWSWETGILEWVDDGALCFLNP